MTPRNDPPRRFCIPGDAAHADSRQHDPRRSAPGERSLPAMNVFAAEPGLPVREIETHTIDSDTLRKNLEQHLEGEVRFDNVSRALYSTDASVYQIERDTAVAASGT